MRRTPRGRLELTWMGKDSALIPAEDGKYDYAWVDPNDPRALEVKSLETVERVGEVDGPSGGMENLLVVGDSGDALRSLGTIPEYANKYLGQVKLVYIDPPFNTGEVFDHYADQLEHSVWLTMMRDRIRELKPLLAGDASVWVHLDHSESHRMRLLLDEEFGPENFIAEVAWQKAVTPRNNAGLLSTSQDSIIAYRTSRDWRPNRLERLSLSDSRHGSQDGDPVPWRDNPTDAPGASTHQGMVYAIQHPITGELMYTKVGRCWGREQSWFLEQMNEYAPFELREIDDAPRRALICGKTPDSVRKGVKALMLAVPLEEAAAKAQARYDAGLWPTVYLTRKGRGGIQFKAHQTDIQRVPDTLWLASEVGANIEGKAEIQNMFPGITPFATPKPERLLQRIIQIASNPGDLVLDCFAGSGTTAAVAQKMGRRWLTVELQESTAKSFIVPRLTKVVEGTDPGGITSRTERCAVNELPEGVTPGDAQKFTSLLGKFTEGVTLGIDVVSETAKHARQAAKSENAPLTVEETKTLTALLRKLGEASDDGGEIDVMPQVRTRLRAAAKTRNETTLLWEGGGGFTVAKIGPSMYEVDDQDGEVFLSPEATNGAWSKAIAGQLKFTFTPEHPVFCGVRKRQRLAVIDGVADETLVRTVVEHLGDKEKAMIVAKGVLPEAAELLQNLSPGSRIKKAPTDIFPKGTVK